MRSYEGEDHDSDIDDEVEGDDGYNESSGYYIVLNMLSTSQWLICGVLMASKASFKLSRREMVVIDCVYSTFEMPE